MDYCVDIELNGFCTAFAHAQVYTDNYIFEEVHQFELEYYLREYFFRKNSIMFL